MLILELSCLAIIVLYLGVRGYYEEDRLRLFRRIGLMSTAAWIAEDSVIHAYHFYQYSPRWSVFVDQVPLMVLLIWPIVITSGWDLMNGLAGRSGGRRVILATAAMVFVDAYVMEPIAVQAGLWSWNEPGLFRVPPIGVLGWSFFAAGCLVVYDWVDQNRRSPWLDLSVLVLPIAFTHAALLATWWAALRWVSHPISSWVGVGLAWALTTTLAVIAWRHPAARRVTRRDLVLRIPAAGFFFVLLGLRGSSNTPLIAYAVSFAAPYLVLTWRARGE